LNSHLDSSRSGNPQHYVSSAVWVIAKLQRKMKEVIMGRILFAALTRTSLAATAFVATSLIAAQAAELPVQPPPAPVYYNWTGPYLGLNLGGSWGHQSGDIFDERGLEIFDFTTHPNGVIGGGQIGFNWQFAPWFGWGNGTVLGLEADIQGSSERDSADFAILDARVPVSANFGDKLEWFGTVRGRVGIAFDRVLPYVTGGWAVGNRKISGEITEGAVETLFSASGSNLSGWTVGGGVEWAFWDHWTAKFEYLYIDFGNRDNNNAFFGPTVVPVSPFHLTADHFIENIARAGVNYKF
jgi:outer membrane immunogenic protein